MYPFNAILCYKFGNAFEIFMTDYIFEINLLYDPFQLVHLVPVNSSLTNI